jgi:hypothetical protein
MEIEQLQEESERNTRFAASISATPDGRWVTRIDLGAGASLSRLFPDEEQARRYPEELAAWLGRRRDSA